jgi:tetratricopeptide (TPR) repeat protein
VALLAALTVRQTAVWQDDVTLWTRAIEVRPRASGRVYAQRAAAWAERGEWGRARADLDEAIALAAARRYDLICSLYAERARIRARLGDRDGAAADWGLAVWTAPEDRRAALEAERAEAVLAAP